MNLLLLKSNFRWSFWKRWRSTCAKDVYPTHVLVSWAAAAVTASDFRSTFGRGFDSQPARNQVT